MEKLVQRKLFGGIFLAAIFLSACILPEKEDPFARLPEEETEVLEGVVFPFAVSVSTRATHRLEDDGKLVGYLASDIVRLSDFEGQTIEAEGVMRTEKMREIFWVESVHLKDSGEEEEKIEERFSTRQFSFIHPSIWEHSMSPSGVVHFLAKEDAARRVFLTFSVEDMTKEDKETDPNVLIANMAGVKKITTDELERERQEITLFSNLYDKKYRFIFTSQFEEFEKKKAFFKLLSTFIEGEENVRKAEEEDLKQQAEEEAAKIEIPTEEAEIPEVTDSPEAPEGVETPGETESKEDILKGTEALAKIVEEDTNGVPVPDTGEFRNLIDANAFPYQSAYYRFRMKVPWGFWFRNFGQTENAIARIGFSNEDFTDSADAKFWLEVLGDENPPKVFSERQVDGQLVIEFPRSDKSFFRLSGPLGFRDAMRSIHLTVEGW